MELYLLLSFFLLYFIMSFFVKEQVQNKVWTIAFITAFIVTSISIVFLKIDRQDVMMSAGELNWYYMLYLFGSMSVVFGVINLWMYRHALIEILWKNDQQEKN